MMYVRGSPIATYLVNPSALAPSLIYGSPCQFPKRFVYARTSAVYGAQKAPRSSSRNVYSLQGPVNRAVELTKFPKFVSDDCPISV